MKTSFSAITAAFFATFTAQIAFSEIEYDDYTINDLGNAVSVSENHDDVLLVRDVEGRLHMGAKNPQLFGCVYHNNVLTEDSPKVKEVTYLVEDTMVRFSVICDTNGLGVWLTPATLLGYEYVNNLLTNQWSDVNIHGYEFSTDGYEDIKKHQLEASRGI